MIQDSNEMAGLVGTRYWVFVETTNLPTVVQMPNRTGKTQAVQIQPAEPNRTTDVRKAIDGAFAWVGMAVLSYMLGRLCFRLWDKLVKE